MPRVGYQDIDFVAKGFEEKVKIFRFYIFEFKHFNHLHPNFWISYMTPDYVLQKSIYTYLFDMYMPVWKASCAQAI